MVVLNKADKSISEAIGWCEAYRILAYNIDLLHPGFYLWLGKFTLRLGGFAQPDDAPYRYPGDLRTKVGVAIVLPGYKVFTTYRQSFDREK
jgi:hypothetical protein